MLPKYALMTRSKLTTDARITESHMDAGILSLATTRMPMTAWKASSSPPACAAAASTFRDEAFSTAEHCATESGASSAGFWDSEATLERALEARRGDAATDDDVFPSFEASSRRVRIRYAAEDASSLREPGEVSGVLRPCAIMTVAVITPPVLPVAVIVSRAVSRAAIALSLPPTDVELPPPAEAVTADTTSTVWGGATAWPPAASVTLPLMGKEP
mmetsp:Transcript_8629/g.20070  ORF Transcript_8629/g.20070 Transcript_8629/m.20070 type:complete len:216 (+) Transcript_8629:904-1551(+)